MRIIVFIALLVCSYSFSQNGVYSAAVIKNYDKGVQSYSTNNFGNAKSFFLESIRLDSTCFEAYIGLGLIYFKEKKFKNTLVICEKAKQYQPFNGVLFALMGKAYFQEGNYTKAEKLLKQALTTDENRNENKLYLALTLQKQEKTKESLYYFDGLIAAFPENIEYVLNRAYLFSEMEEYDKALIDYKEALAISPENSSICIHLARTCFLQNRSERARGYIELGLRKANKEEKINLLLLKGKYFQEKEELIKAAEYYDEAFELDRENALVLTSQASVLIDMEKYETAIEKCNAAIEISPIQMEAYFNRGIAYEMVRNVQNACDDWQKAFILGSQKAIEYLNSPVCNE